MEALLTPSGIIGTIGIIAAGLAVALLGTNKTLRDAATDLRARVDDLEKANAATKVELAEEKAAHAITRQDLDAVKRVVTGETHWVAIENQLSDHHRQAMTAWDQIRQAIEQVARKIGGG